MKGVVQSIGVKVLGGLISLALLIINSNELGPMGVGTIAIAVLSISLVVMANDLVGGSALIYFTPRYTKQALLKPAYLWAMAVNLVALPLLMMLPFTELICYTITGIALLQCTNAIHLNVIIGSKQVKVFNSIVLIQLVVLLGLVVIFYYVLKSPGILEFLIAMLISQLVQLILSATFVIRTKGVATNQSDSAFKTLLGQGFYVQMANIAQLLNYRVSYYLIELLCGFTARVQVGWVSASNNIAESVWYVPKGISVVQTGEISNMELEEERVEYTCQIYRMILWVIVPLVTIIFFLPKSLFVWVLGEEFDVLSSYIDFLLPGVLLLSLSTILVNYFSGTGRYRVNALGSITGLIVTLGAGYFLIGKYGAKGALITASISYTFTFLFMFTSFLRIAKPKITNLIPRWSDLRLWTNQLRRG